MLTKADIHHVIDVLELRDKPHMIYMGGSLCIRGIRDTNDIDLAVDGEDFKEICKRYGKENEITCPLIDRKIDLEIDGIKVELFERTSPLFINEADEIDGLLCQKINEIINMKRRFNREKDKKDIELLKSLGYKAQ